MRFRFRSIQLSAALLSATLLSAGMVAEDAAASEVRLQAVVAEGAKPLGEPLSWVVTRLSGQSGTPGAVVATPKGAAPKLSLEPGRYAVSVKYGDAEAHDEIVVKGDARHVLNLNAGFIRLDMILHAGAPAVTEDVTWEVYRYARGQDVDDSRKVTVAVAPSQLFVLPAGYYTVRARYAGTVADMVLPVAAGHRFNYTLNLYAGKVGLSAVAEKGVIEDDVTWQIVRAVPGKDGKRQVIAKTVAASPKLLLREGRYIVFARSGSLAGEAPLEIKAGNTQTIKVKLKKVNADG